jgi:hypothetical protein
VTILGYSYIAYNGPMCTTAPPSKVTTGTSTKTMLQLAPTVPVKPIAWGISFDGAAAATPGVCELIETNVAATVTAYAVADIQPYTDPNAPPNTSGTSGIPLGLGTANSGYTASAEGSVTATRMADLQQIAPTNQYLQQWPLSREFFCKPGNFLRVRVTFGAAVDALTWVIFEM